MDPPGHVKAWSAYGQGYQIDTQVHHGGAQSLTLSELGRVGRHPGRSGSTRLISRRAIPILVTGWSKAQEIDGVADNDYAIYVDVTYTDGTSLWGQTAPFETGSHGWQHQQLMIFPSKPVRFINVYALFRNHTGTAWFDDFDATEVTSDSLFDGQNLAPPVLPHGAQSGWFVRDVAAGTPLRQITASKATLGLRLDSPKAMQGGQIVQAMLHNQTSQESSRHDLLCRAFRGAQTIWWNDIRDGVPATDEREYANLTQAGAGATGQLSLYPFGCVTGGKQGLVLGMLPSLGPRVVRIAFSPKSHLLYLACDLALTAKGDQHDHAPVAVAHYNIDPSWGFRDAAAKFYALFPDAYRRRAKAEGIWMPFTDPSKVTGLSDFHITFHEGDNSVASDRQNKILSFRYVEPMTYWMPMTKDTPRTYTAAVAQVQTLAAANNREAQAVLSSGSQDMRGQFNVAFRDEPWCNGAVWVLNPNPQMGKTTDLWTKAKLNHVGEPIPGAVNQPDGEYLDSLEAWADVLDYRPESLRASNEALCFTPSNPRPTLPTWFSVYEATASLSQDLHRHGKLLMANSIPWRFTAFASLLDVMGTETNVFSDTGVWTPEPDAIMNLRRTASYHKPYLLLLNTDFTKVDGAKIARYFQRCLFYGIYPSMFSANAADHPYWEDPKLYNRDRPLFRKYIPIVQHLSAAGWEPVTWARSSRSDVWLERYGRTYLTVLNSNDAPAETTIKIDTARFFPSASGRRAKLVIHDVLSGQDLGTISMGPSVPIHLMLQGQETRVLSLKIIRDTGEEIYPDSFETC